MSSLREDPARARRALEAKRREIALLLDGAEAAPTEAAEDDDASGVEILERQAMAQDIEHRRRQELARVEAALERLDAGDYGWCVACGEPIPDARLELDPAAALCVACAERR